RHGSHRVGGGAPDIDDREAALEQRRGFLLAEPVAHPLRPRLHGVVVMRPPHRLAYLLLLADAFVAGAQRMVEHDDIAGTGLAPDERFYLGIVDGLDLTGIVEIGDSGFMAHQRE